MASNSSTNMAEHYKQQQNISNKRKSTSGDSVKLTTTPANAPSKTKSIKHSAQLANTTKYKAHPVQFQHHSHTNPEERYLISVTIYAPDTLTKEPTHLAAGPISKSEESKAKQSRSSVLTNHAKDDPNMMDPSQSSPNNTASSEKKAGHHRKTFENTFSPT